MFFVSSLFSDIITLRLERRSSLQRTCGCRVIDTFTEDDDDGEEVGLSVLRRSNAALLSDTDRRYAGKAVSRKQLMSTERSDEEDEEEDDEEEEEEEDVSMEELEEGVEEYLEEEEGRRRAVMHNYMPSSVKSQLALWDQLLEGRIKAQKVLRSLLELHDQLLYQNPDTRAIAVGRTGTQSKEEEIDSDEDGEGSPYRDTILQKWHDRTRLNMGKSCRGFGAFDRNILTQVEQGEEVEPHLKANTHLKDVDKDIFDDDDFYHQLLRELIERKTSATDPNDQVAMGRQWLAIQKLRSKVKKKVDTKASKGRKVRFHIHSKLANFMAPIDHSSMSDEARSELYEVSL
ncbi:hypothetical protein INR49_008721, partial [Caranx melampygus]